MLYDDENQLEVRHVISLAHYKVDIYGGGERIPEGELWIKRNCMLHQSHMLPAVVASTHARRHSVDSTAERRHFS